MVALFVAFMFVSLVLMDLGVEKWKAWQVRHSMPVAGPADVMAHGMGTTCPLPEGVHLTDRHVWLKPDPTGGLEIGADALMVHALGVVRRIVLPKVGDQVTAGQPLFRLEHNGRSVTVPSAITGRVMEVNDRLADRPELLSADPYGDGWVCRVSPTHMEESAASARFGEQAAMWLETEFARFREFILGQVSPDFALGVTNQDGGIPAPGCLAELGPTVWSAFEASFLHQS